MQQKAIRLGVSRFLLKPSKMDELEEALVYMTGVLDTLPEEKTEISGKEDGSESANSFLVRQAQAYIAEHYACRLSLQEVADHCYVSQWYLSKLLHKHLGIPFYDLLRQCPGCRKRRNCWKIRPFASVKSPSR